MEDNPSAGSMYSERKRLVTAVTSTFVVLGDNEVGMLKYYTFYLGSATATMKI
jgi:hypothetical protein